MMRTMRQSAQAMPTLMVAASPSSRKHRLIYDAGSTNQLPGNLVRSEGDAATGGAAVDEAFEFSGDVFDFYDKVFQRNSLDDQGMTLTSTVHYAEPDFLSGQFVPMNNAFWNGSQMAYGDGDGIVFERFTKSLDVVGHELAHGVQSFTSNLTYYGESGALNEHFADVFGVLVRQWKLGQSVAHASWLVGAELIVAAPTRHAIRNMEKPGTAFVNDPDMGTDQQPDHISKKYTGFGDNGGVHINSGIPNRAFVEFAKKLGGNAWEAAGRIWYSTMVQLTRTSQFIDCAKLTVQIAGTVGSPEKRAAKAAWKSVGINV